MAISRAMQFERGGVRIHYRWDGQGPDLLLIHGVGGRLEAWDDVVEDLKGDFRILRLDLRGHGLSDKPRDRIFIDEFVADIEALLDHEGIAKIHVAGFSLGGLTAQAFALAHPERINKLAIMGAVAGRTPEEMAKVRERLAILTRMGPIGHFDASVERWFTKEFIAARPDVIARRRSHAEAMDPECYVAAYTILAENDFAARLHEVKLPTLVATGECDVGSNPRMSQIMHEKIAGSKLHIFPKLRHSLLFEAPHEVSRVLGDFLRDKAA